MTATRKRLIINFLLTFALCAVLTLIVSLFNLDIGLSRLFYRDQSWYLGKFLPWSLLYEYGTIPALLLGTISLIYIIVSFFHKRYIERRKYAMLILLALIIGPGLLVNSVFKDRWGRPRPRQIQQFDGKWEFREAWEPGIPGKGNSFPCGHASMGFYFIVLYYVYRNRSRTARYSIAASALAFGTIIGTARIVQGGHFISDVIWSAGITNMTAAALSYLLIDRQLPNRSSIGRSDGPKPRTKKYAVAASMSIFIPGLIWLFIFAKPAYKEYEHSVREIDDISYINLSVTDTIGDIELIISESSWPVKVRTEISSLGYPKKKFKSALTSARSNDTLYVSYTLSADGIFTRIKSHSAIMLTSDKPFIISAAATHGDMILPEKNSVIIALDVSVPRGKVYYSTSNE